MTRAAMLAALCLLLGTPARADEEERSKAAAQHFESGMARFNLQEWDGAIGEWQAGYRIKPAPEFLYNIGQAYRLSKRSDKALQFYETYLRVAPRAPNRAEVQRHINALREILKREQAGASAAPVEPSATPPPSTPAQPPTALPAREASGAPAGAGEPAASTVVAPDAAMRRRKRALVWGLVAGAVVVVGVAVGVGVGVGAADHDSRLPAVRF
jgi:tetratricopeptide (TPR) repeat protein